MNRMPARLPGLPDHRVTAVSSEGAGGTLLGRIGQHGHAAHSALPTHEEFVGAKWGQAPRQVRSHGCRHQASLRRAIGRQCTQSDSSFVSVSCAVTSALNPVRVIMRRVQLYEARCSRVGAQAARERLVA